MDKHKNECSSALEESKMTRFLDFMEIGTSDFNALIMDAKDEDHGISIDPVGYYLERLPNPKNCKKINIGVSDQEGFVSVNYLHPDDILNYELPAWLRGCNAIGEIHPTVESVLKRNKISLDIVRRSQVRVEKLSSIISQENISGIFFLKVDTEGHDIIILRKFFEEANPTHYPHELLFETNVLSDSDQVHTLIAKLILAGYEIVKCETGGGQTDTFLRLNILRVKNRTRFTDEIKGHYLPSYPTGYDPRNAPHENTLSSAMNYCRKVQMGGVTYQYGRYEVREGKYLRRHKTGSDLRSWILIGT